MSMQVTRYYARWSPERHQGYVAISWSGEGRVFSESSFQNPVEFQIVVDLLRNEKPVWWDQATGRLYASQEPVGEGE